MPSNKLSDLYQWGSTLAVGDVNRLGKPALLAVSIWVCLGGSPAGAAEARYQYWSVGSSVSNADVRLASNYRFPVSSLPRLPQGLETDVCAGSLRVDSWSCDAPPCFERGFDGSVAYEGGSCIESWAINDYFYANVWSGLDPQVDFWRPNSKIDIHSGFKVPSK